MIRRVRNFKRFLEETFELADAVVLAGPNNAGKSTLLQAIATWKLGLDRWAAQRAGGKAVTRSGVAIPCADFTSVPLREMNLLWKDRRVTGPDVVSVRDRDPEAVDDALLGLAHEERRVLVTEDKDFGELAFVRRQQHPCIVRFSVRAKRSGSRRVTSDSFRSSCR